MRIFHFDKTKYGKELLMDLGRFEGTPKFFSPLKYTVQISLKS